jgi:hypothetical protein
MVLASGCPTDGREDPVVLILGNVENFSFLYSLEMNNP